MSLYYLSLGSYWRNHTSPLAHWHRGTAFQMDTMKEHPEMLSVHTKLGTDMVMLTMAARITQSVFMLARNLLNRRPLGWRMLPDSWKAKAFQAMLWLCWNLIDLLLAMEVTRVYIHKNMSKHSACCHTGQSMNTISIECRWGCETEPNTEKMIPEEEELSCLRMETLQEKPDMGEDFDHKVFSDMDIMMTKETLLSTCTNPLILSMICVPSEDGESSPPSVDSSLSESESECGDEEEESESECGDDVSELECGENRDSEKEDPSLEETSVDSGVQESWTPKSKEDLNLSDEESDWSDEEDSSWDEDSDTDCSKNSDLWASFCRNDDPYNPLSFAMPMRSPKHQEREEVIVASCDKQESSAKRSTSRVKQEDHPEVLNCSKKVQAKKPILSSFKSSHKCASQRQLEEFTAEGNTPTKKVRFASNIVVHHMVTWNYAYRKARKGPWEEYARDHCRFQKRIAETEAAIGFCLKPCHREKIWATLYCSEDRSLAC